MSNHNQEDFINELSGLNIDDLLKNHQNEEGNIFDMLKDFDISNDYVFRDGVYALRLKFTNLSDNPDPDFATSGSSGFDFRANLKSPEYDGSVVIPAGKVVMVPTGLYFELPENFEIQVRPRSGLAAKFGVTVLNTPGTIDSDYRGEIVMIMYNTGAMGDFTVNHGDRIAQGVVASVMGKKMINWEKNNNLNKTDRGTGGFGHSGIK